MFADAAGTYSVPGLAHGALQHPRAEPEPEWLVRQETPRPSLRSVLPPGPSYRKRSVLEVTSTVFTLEKLSQLQGNNNERFKLKNYTKTVYIMSALAWFLLPSWTLGQTQQWSEAQANAWYAQQPWLVGSDYVPTNPINQLEMWQAETFDPK